LDKVGRAAGIPSGNKLIWPVFVASGTVTYDLIGQYEISSSKKHDARVMCKISGEVCLRPASTKNRWRENLALAILGMRLEANERDGSAQPKQ
jgi:hypothetical protein